MPKGDHLGDLEELILLAALGAEDAHGNEIRRALESRAARRVSISTVYVTLMRLEEKGHVRSWKGEPSSERGGKAKRHYAVTPEGMEALARVRRIRDLMWEAVGEGPAGA